MFEASLVICTHNPRPQYLRRVLELLRDQTLPLEKWELLLIDNASEEPLTSRTWDISWHPHGRIIREDKIGLTPARIRGIQESSADLIVFVDDDNILDPNYLEEANRIKVEWPRLGVWGAGVIAPEFEVRPAAYLTEFLEYLALRQVNTCRWSNMMPCYGAHPWGAGQCVRAPVARAYRDHAANACIEISDRRGKDLASGGDVEISYVACSLGFGVGIFPELRVIHLIPANRVEEDYLVRNFEGGVASSILLDFKWQNVVPPSPLSGLGLLRIVRNLLNKRGVHRRMYLGWLRATIRMRRVILSNKLDRQVDKATLSVYSQ